MKMKRINLYNVVKSAEIEAQVVEVLRSGQLGSGDIVKKFELNFAEYNGSEHSIACSDMTSAIELIFKVIGIGAGDEVLASPFACLSTNSAIVTSGAKAIWVDNSENSPFLDLEDIANKITERTKALIVYHLAGYICNIEKIAQLCKQRKIILIEDCNNALGSTYRNIKVGNFGDFSVYSFYPNRYLHTIEGGMIVCSNIDYVQKAIRLRKFGIDFSTFRDFDGEINKNSDVQVISNSKVLNNVNATVGLVQLEQLDQKLSKVRENFIKLKHQIKSIKEIIITESHKDSEPVPWVMLLELENRDSFLSYLKICGVQVSKIHCRNDVYSGFGESNNIALPNLDAYEKRLIGIPCGWWLSNDDISYVSNCIKNFFK